MVGQLSSIVNWSSESCWRHWSACRPGGQPSLAYSVLRFLKGSGTFVVVGTDQSKDKIAIHLAIYVVVCIEKGQWTIFSKSQLKERGFYAPTLFVWEKVELIRRTIAAQPSSRDETVDWTQQFEENSARYALGSKLSFGTKLQTSRSVLSSPALLHAALPRLELRRRGKHQHYKFQTPLKQGLLSILHISDGICSPSLLPYETRWLIIIWKTTLGAIIA